jgi:hypothetical protein
MSFGIKVTNTNGKTIISDSTVNPVFRGKAVHSSQLLLSGGKTYRQTFTFTCDEDIIPFVAANEGYAFSLARVSRTGSVWSIHVFTLNDQAVANVRVYIFSQIPLATVVSDGYGITVRKANGELAFSSTLNNLAPTGSSPSEVPSAVPYPTGGAIGHPSMPASYQPNTYIGGAPLGGAVPAYGVTTYQTAIPCSNAATAATNLAISSYPVIRWGYAYWTNPPYFSIDYYDDEWIAFCRLISGQLQIAWEVATRTYIYTSSTFDTLSMGGGERTGNRQRLHAVYQLRPLRLK